VTTNLHIVGCPRSGTTLLTEMIATCFYIDGSCEHEETIFKVSPDHKGIYLSKKPNDVLWVDRIIDRDPALHVIALMRDPRSVICSVHQGHPGMYFCNYPVWSRAEKAIAKLAKHPRLLVIRYEDLVSNPDAVQKIITQRFPFLKPKHPLSAFHLHAKASEKSENALGGVREVEASRIVGWQKHLPRLKQQMAKYPQLVDDLKRYQYESGDDWMKELKEVRAENFPCRYSDHKEWLKYWEQKIRFRGKINRYLQSRGLK